jgi:hypothetical protein
VHREARDAAAVNLIRAAHRPGFRVGHSPHRGREQPLPQGAASKLYRRPQGQLAGSEHFLNGAAQLGHRRKVTAGRGFPARAWRNGRPDPARQLSAADIAD